MSFLPNSRCALQATHLLALNPWLHRWDGLGVSRTAFLRQGGAPISYAADDRRRVQHIVAAQWRDLRVPSPITPLPAETIIYSSAESLFVHRHRIGLLLLYYTIISYPVS